MAEIKDQLISKIKNQSAVIGIVGLGYVGLPLALRYSNAGFKVIGFDTDKKKIDQLNDGSSYIRRIDKDDIERALGQGMQPSTEFRDIEKCDAIILCVPTPLDDHRQPDLSYVIGSTNQILPYIRAGQVISLESTTYPGTTDEELVPLLGQTGSNIGQDIFVLYSPEREDPGNKDFNTQSIPKICSGHTTACLEVGVALYEAAIDVVIPVSSTRVAETTKLLENIHRAVNIGLVNEMKLITDKMGIDIFEVIDAAATKPFGFTPYYPGPGLGGHCIPIDPFYLTWKAREYGVHTRFIELAGEVNTQMPRYVVSKLSDALNTTNKSVKGSKLLMLGVAYKKNVDDMRESPAAEIISILQNMGAEVSYSDPHVPTFPPMRRYQFSMDSIEINESVLKDFDALVLATDHDQFDYELIERSGKIIIDTRGRYRESSPHIVRA